MMVVQSLKSSWGPGSALAAFFGAAFSLILAPAVFLGVEQLRRNWDAANPPVEMELLWVRPVAQGAINMQFRVTRKEDCDFVRMVGFTGPDSSDMRPAMEVRRLDGADPISYPLGISVRSNIWHLSPVYGKKLVLRAYYDCEGRVFRSKIIDTEIPG